MKVQYDKEADAAYIQLSSKKPAFAIEANHDIIVHLTKKDEVVGIEILRASCRFPIKNLYTLTKEAPMAAS